MPTWQCRSRDFISDCRPQQYPSDACGVSRFVLWPLRNGKWRKKPDVSIFLSGRVAVLLERLGETYETYGYWLWKRNWELRYRIATPKQRWKKWTWSLSFYPIFRKQRLKNCHSTSWVNAAKCHATAWSMSLGFRLRLSCTCQVGCKRQRHSYLKRLKNNIDQLWSYSMKLLV